MHHNSPNSIVGKLSFESCFSPMNNLDVGVHCSFDLDNGEKKVEIGTKLEGEDKI